MSSRRPRTMIVGAGVVVCSLLLGLTGCGEEITQDSSPKATVLTAPSATGAPSSGVVDPGGPTESFTELLAASVSAVEGLGPVRVTIVETVYGRTLDMPDSGGDEEAQVKKVEQLLDTPGGRGRLVVRGPGGELETTVVDGKERTTLTGGLGTLTTGLVAYSRYVSLEPPAGLPMPLWAGNVVAPTHGYADIPSTLSETSSTLSEAGGEEATTESRVERLTDGGRRLSWELSAQGWASTLTVLLDAELLPVRLDLHGEGEIPAGGELPEGTRIEYSLSLAYDFDKNASFSASDFTLEPPEHYWRQGVTYELSTGRPWSEHADWGQYWLGNQVGEWELVRAEHVSHEDDPGLGAGAEPADELVSLIYDRPGAPSDNESIQVMVRPLRGRVFEDSRAFADERVASGDWVRRETTLAGVAAIVYSGAVEGSVDERADSMTVFLPDALLEVQLWAPVDPGVVLNAIRRVE